MTRRRATIVVAILLLAATTGFWLARPALQELSPLGVGRAAPNFSATTLDTPPRTKTLADYKGQVVLLNLWATWCAPCRAEMPSIEALYRAYGPKGLKVVAVSIDDAGADAGIRAFVRDMRMDFEVLHDPAGNIQTAYQATGVPESVIIGRDGIIRKKVAGAADWNTEETRALIAQLLAE